MCLKSLYCSPVFYFYEMRRKAAASLSGTQSVGGDLLSASSSSSRKSSGSVAGQPLPPPPPPPAFVTNPKLYQKYLIRGGARATLSFWNMEFDKIPSMYLYL